MSKLSLNSHITCHGKVWQCFAGVKFEAHHQPRKRCQPAQCSQDISQQLPLGSFHLQQLLLYTCWLQPIPLSASEYTRPFWMTETILWRHCLSHWLPCIICPSWRHVTGHGQVWTLCPDRAAARYRTLPDLVGVTVTGFFIILFCKIIKMLRFYTTYLLLFVCIAFQHQCDCMIVNNCRHHHIMTPPTADCTG